MGFPTSHEIEEMVEKSWGQGKDPNSRNYSPNLQARMVGHDHELSGDYKSKDQWISEVEGTISGLIDVDKGTAFEVVQVIGGGDSPWACIEMKGTGKSKLGMNAIS